MTCKHCWVHGSKKCRPLEVHFWNHAISEAQDLGLRLIKITGGEPVLEKSLLFAVVENDISCTIETNGTLLNESDIKHLSEFNVTEIDVSIDFPDPQRFEIFRGFPHSFEKATSTVRLIHQYGIPVVCVMSVFKDNLQEVGAVADLAFDLGADMFKAHPVTAIGRAKDFTQRLLSLRQYIEFAQVLEEVEQLYPGKVGTSLPWILTAAFASEKKSIMRSICKYKNLLTLLPNGDISLCGIGITHPSTILGNITEKGIGEIWCSEQGILESLRKMEPLQIEGICGKCIFRKYCANMCPAYVYEVYGTFTASYPLCEDLRASGLFPEKYLLIP